MTERNIEVLELPQSDVESYAHLQASLVEDYIDRPEGETDAEWMQRTLHLHVPEMDVSEIDTFIEVAQTTVAEHDKFYASAEAAVASGETLQQWFERTMREAATVIGPQELVTRLQQVDDVLGAGNRQMLEAITTRSGTISQCPNLDGFIAEQQIVATFNARVALQDSPYRARVRVPELGQPYGSNSVDIEIYHIDAPAHAVRKYQAKYGADSQATADYLRKGDYRGQRKLVPAGQADAIPGAYDHIESPDGKITSKPLSKAEAKALQVRAQRGKEVKVSWDSLQAKALLKEVGKQAGIAALIAAGLTAGFEIGAHVLAGEPIDTIDFGAVLLDAGKAGIGVGLITACIAGVKVAIERGWIPGIPPGTPAHIIATVVQVAVANAKTLWGMIKGEITVMDGLKAMEMTTMTTVCGIVCAFEGAKFGAILGTALGPIGAFVGGLVGGILGFFVGSKAGEYVVKARRKITSAIASGIEKAREALATRQETARDHAVLQTAVVTS